MSMRWLHLLLVAALVLHFVGKTDFVAEVQVEELSMGFVKQQHPDRKGVFEKRSPQVFLA